MHGEYDRIAELLIHLYSRETLIADGLLGLQAMLDVHFRHLLLDLASLWRVEVRYG